MFKTSVLTLICSFLFAFALTWRVECQITIPTDAGMGGVNAITGTVLIASGRIERRVSVRLQSMTRGDRTAVTDENGNFAFRGLPPGDYTIVIDKEKEFLPFSQTVSVIQPRGHPPVSQMMSIRLAPKANSEAKPGVVSADAAGVPKAALAFYNRAIELGRAGDRAGAIAQLDLAIAEHPDFMLAFNEMGVQYMKMNELVRSEGAFKSALKINSEAFMPLTNYGILLVGAKRFADAEPLLRRALKVNAGSPVAHYFLGQSLANQGKFPEAEKELLSALESGSEEMNEARRLLAILYTSRGNKSEAAKVLETYLKIAPKTPDANRLRATIKQLKGSGP